MKMDIDNLESKLSLLAYEWRGHSSSGQHLKADKAVRQYHEILEILWESGWRGGGLTPDEELPDHLIPSYWIAFWRKE